MAMTGALMVVLLTWLAVVQPSTSSHVVHDIDHLEAVVAAAPEAVPASIVSPESRTAYHFRPPKNWINDPNGPMYYKGFYHMFYQYNPKGAIWGNIVWAHSISRDLINWMALDIAIFPTSPLEANGSWSGSATILPNGTPVIMYTMADKDQNQTQALAFPKNPNDPYLREWYKPSINPIIVPENDIDPTKFRDPTTAWFGPDKYWRILIGSVKGDRGMALTYRSKDFKNWVRIRRPLHSALTGMWECPDFYPVLISGKDGLDTSAYGEGIKHVLKNSLDRTRYDYYTIGTYHRGIERYEPDAAVGDERLLRYDYGNFYASKTFYDPSKRRRILVGWANESDSTVDDVAKGWAGIHAIPRVIYMDQNGRQLLQWPIKEVEMLRESKVSFKNMLIKAGSFFEVRGMKNPAQADVDVAFEISSLEKVEAFDPSWKGYDAEALCGVEHADVSGGVGPFGLWVLASGELQERTAIFFRVFKQGSDKHVVLMCSDPTRSSLSQGLYKPTFAGFVDIDLLQTKRRISLRTLIDHSVVESFGAGGKTVILSRVYPSIALGSGAHLFVFNHGAADVEVTQLTAWDMKKPMMMNS